MHGPVAAVVDVQDLSPCDFGDVVRVFDARVDRQAFVNSFVRRHDSFDQLGVQLGIGFDQCTDSLQVYMRWCTKQTRE